MTWAEFQIRLFAWDRMEQRKDIRAREIAYASLISFNIDAKKIPKTKNSFWKIGNDKPTVSITDAHKEAFLQAHEQYLKQVANAKNNR